jgi:peptide/nickel transport system permease protein
MIRYILRRLISFIPTIFMITLVGFIIMQIPPGDYVDNLVRLEAARGNLSARDQAEGLRAQFGLDQSLPVQYFNWLGQMVRGDFGESFYYRESISKVIGDRLGATLIVSACVFIVSWGIGIPLGVYSATHQYSKADNTLTTLAFIGLGLPDFLIALVLLVGTWQLTGEVLTGLQSPEFLTAPWSLEALLDFLKHLWLPVIAVVVTGTAWVMRVVRGNLLNELGKNYVTALRAKGVPERSIIWKHAFRNSLHPLVGALGGVLAYLINGFTLTSIVLGLPTVQSVYLTATLQQDIYLAGTILTMIGLLVMLGNLLSDVLLAWLDPRIRFA